MNFDERAGVLRRVFTPARPIQDQDMFAGRQNQLHRMLNTLDSPGEHAVIFGERGVGKTSLATVAEATASLSHRLALRVNCVADDDVSSIWSRTGQAIGRRLRVDQALGADNSDVSGVASEAVAKLIVDPTSEDALGALELLATVRSVVLILDEFDRVGDTTVHTEVVDLMKTVSDLGLDITIVIVGVAHTVDSLIDEHESIGRALNQIEMPRMSHTELLEVLTRGFDASGMSMDGACARVIAEISMGLPHYTHLLGLHAGLVAASRGDSVRTTDLLEALPTAVARAEHHVSELYAEACDSTRDNIFKEVLLAAAVCDKDPRGFFAPGDLRGPLAPIMGREVGISAFSRHLARFSDDRGPVFEKSSHGNRPRYRFTEPLLVPYVAMRGINEGLIDVAHLQATFS